MATPLRKDQPDFDDTEAITTADLAQGKRPAPAADARGPQAVARERNPEQESRNLDQESRGNEASPLFPENELEGLRTRWKEIQTGFVDEPRKAVEQADGLSLRR